MDAYVIEALRTPRGRPGKGVMAAVRPVDWLLPLFRALPERSGLPVARVEDVLLGCVTQTGPQGGNLGKIASLYAGWPATVSGATTNRFCASGLDVLAQAASRVAAGASDVLVAGGIECISQAAMFGDNGPYYADPEVRERTGFVHMGVAADLVAALAGLSRVQLDAYAVESQRRAALAKSEGHFARSLVPLRNQEQVLSEDELVRPTSLEKLAALAPAFGELTPASLAARHGLSKIEALHTVGTSPALADGAALALVTNGATAKTLGLRPRAKILGVGVASVDPTLLTGNVAATEVALRRAGLGAAAIDRFEVNESFAAVALHYQHYFGLDRDRFNGDGGAIALGHPLGATGIVLTSTLIDALERYGLRRGVVSICGAAGVALAVVLERV